jgi:phthalate 4,5-dioxygenase
MLTREENDRLCRVGQDTPMGRMFREYWWPVVRSERVVADGKPIRIRLLGEEYVAFRDTNGELGVVGAHCPHRGVSLALARNEDCGLRCIMHGWKIDVRGTILETPNEPTLSRPERIPVASYPTRVAGGMVWMWPGAGEAPPFPNFPFNSLPVGTQVRAVVGHMRCNWLQPLETLWDPAHVAVLHGQGDSFSEKWAAADSRMAGDMSPAPRSIDCYDTPYGFRFRFDQPGVIQSIDNWFATAMPTWAFAPGRLMPEDDSDRIVYCHVPIDDANTLLWQIIYNTEHEIGAVGSMIQAAVGDPDDYRLPGCDETNDWGQDREAMRTMKSFSGVGADAGVVGTLFEDFAVCESMGGILDRSHERLVSADIAIVRGRKMYFDALDAFEAGSTALGVGYDMAQVGHPSGVEYEAVA